MIFFVEMGVVHQFSCVECLQQNSVAERKHQHLLNVARALYFQSRVPLHFWSHCVLTTAFLINQIPSPLLNHNTPYELLYKKPVNYSSFRVFGCLAFSSTLASQRTKFQPRARTCVFIRYPNGMKAYRLYDIHTKQIFVFGDVVFREEVFPFHFVIHVDHLHDPFPDLVLPHPLLDNSISHDTQSLDHQSSSSNDSSIPFISSLPSSIPSSNAIFYSYSKIFLSNQASLLSSRLSLSSNSF